MSRSTRICLTTGACVAFAIALFARDVRAQFYLGAEGGWTSLPDQDITVPGLFSTSLRFNSGFNAGVRLGYEWGAWRLRGRIQLSPRTTYPAISRYSVFPSAGLAATATPTRS